MSHVNNNFLMQMVAAAEINNDFLMQMVAAKNAQAPCTPSSNSALAYSRYKKSL